MEMVDEEPSDKRLRQLFSDIKKTLQLSSINSDYRTLALWPDYLEPAWGALKPVVQTEAYREAAVALGDHARAAADRFPHSAGFRPASSWRPWREDAGVVGCDGPGSSACYRR